MIFGRCFTCGKIRFLTTIHDCKICKTCLEINEKNTEEEWNKMQERIKLGVPMERDLSRKDMKREDFFVFRFSDEQIKKINGELREKIKEINRRTRRNLIRSAIAARDIYVD